MHHPFFYHNRIIRGFAVLLSGIFLFYTHSALADALLQKALDYEKYYREYHSRGLGGALTMKKTGQECNKVKYEGQGDSTIHTGMYLAAEAFRYAASKDDPEQREEAKQNALIAAKAMHTNLEITGKDGYVARFAGPYDINRENPSFYPAKKCTGGNCHYVRFQPGKSDDSGDNSPESWQLAEAKDADYFWMGNTSRDQYDGWFFGYALAYTLIDDPDLQAMIKKDVARVMDKLEENHFVIPGENPYDLRYAQSAAFSVNFRMGWTLAAAVVLGGRYEELYEKEARKINFLDLEYSLARCHKYSDYFTLMFFHRTAFLILQYDKNPDRVKKYMAIFKRSVRPAVQGTQNVFFDYVYMSFPGHVDEGLKQSSIEALQLFPAPPNVKKYPADLPHYSVDAFSYFTRLFGQDLQATTPFPIDQRCPEDFLWQRSPYKICKFSGTEENKKECLTEYPGIDYLLAYWMGRYLGYIGPGEDIRQEPIN